VGFEKEKFWGWKREWGDDLDGTGYQTALVQELEKYIAIAGLTEARLQDSDLSTVDGATFLHSGGHDRTQGVALVLRHPFNDALVTWQPTSSRLLSARLIHRHDHLSVIVAYASTEDAADADKDALYNDLASVIESVPTHDNLLMLSDFSAVTGPRSAGYEDVVGPFGAGNPKRYTGECYEWHNPLVRLDATTPAHQALSGHCNERRAESGDELEKTS